MMGRTPNIAKMDQPESGKEGEELLYNVNREEFDMLMVCCLFIVTTPKKKAPKRDPKGLKWFKGSTNKTRTPKKLLKHAQKESSPQFIPIPARIVEFDTEGTTERLGISEVLEVIDKVGLSVEEISAFSCLLCLEGRNVCLESTIIIMLC